jgi:hypothetical protein
MYKSDLLRTGPEDGSSIQKRDLQVLEVVLQSEILPTIVTTEEHD